MSDKLSEILAALAKSLQTTAEHVYGLLVRQAIVEGVTYAAMWLVGLSALVVGTRYINRLDDSDDAKGMLGAVMLVGWFIFSLSTILGLPHIVTAIVNPEWYAIEKILRLLK